MWFSSVMRRVKCVTPEDLCSSAAFPGTDKGDVSIVIMKHLTFMHFLLLFVGNSG